MSAHNEKHKTQYTVNGIIHGKLWFALTDMRYANGWFFFVLKYKKNNKTNLEKRSNLFIQIVKHTSETLFQLNQSCSLDDSWYGVARITHYSVF